MHVLVTLNRARFLRLRNQAIDLKLLIFGEAESSESSNDGISSPVSKG